MAPGPNPAEKQMSDNEIPTRIDFLVPIHLGTIGLRHHFSYSVIKQVPYLGASFTNNSNRKPYY